MRQNFCANFSFKKFLVYSLLIKISTSEILELSIIIYIIVDSKISYKKKENVLINLSQVMKYLENKENFYVKN